MTVEGEKIRHSTVFQCLPNCGLCCEDYVAFMPDLLKTHKKDMQRAVLREEVVGNYVLARTEDAMCVFLKSDKTCAIYNLRPLMCRAYGRSCCKAKSKERGKRVTCT